MIMYIIKEVRVEHISTVSLILQSTFIPFINSFLICFVSYRCWFGKEPGKYIDYIYQGPVILVLLVRIYVGGRTLPSSIEGYFISTCDVPRVLSNTVRHKQGEAPSP